MNEPKFNDPNLPTIDITDDLKEEIDKINETLRNSNRFTDDNGVLIGSCWVNWKKEKPAIGELFTGICVVTSIITPDEYEYKFTGKLILENSIIRIEVLEDNLKWLLKSAFRLYENIIYWKEYDNDSPKDKEAT